MKMVCNAYTMRIKTIKTEKKRLILSARINLIKYLLISKVIFV